VENLDFLYPLLTGLIAAGSVEVRQRVGKIFDTQVRELLPLKKPTAVALGGGSK